MWPMRNIQRHYLKTILLFQNRNLLLRDVAPLQASYVTKLRTDRESNFSSFFSLGSVDGFRYMSTSKGRSMRSKVESRMKRETGKTLREIRRAKKLRKKLMTDQERLIYNLRRAKKKVALLLQKLKKYELPDLPPSRHDPELLTPEQLQAYKKIGFRNKNYVPVGVRGVFGGVVQNMHLHWKFHETVQVCCDNFPKEKIKEMATMLARLSGGIVVNVHDVKTIIMFRGRNYRQPKNLIPINTLTKRKALFKARFEQALDSQKLNIKKLEQQLRRMGVNPEDPVAIASIQRVASTFFRAIDEKQGSPYVFQEDKLPVMDPGLRKGGDSLEDIDAASEDSDQEELDRFIAGIEDAADQEWAEEEAKEQEEMGQIRYWNREEMGGRGRRILRSDDSEDETRGQQRHGGDVRSVRRISEIRRWDSDDEIGRASGADESDSDILSGVPNLDSDAESLVHDQDERMPSRSASRKQNMAKGGFKRSGVNCLRGKGVEETPSDDEVGDSEDGSWRSDGAEKPFVSGSKQRGYDYYSSSEDE